MRRPQQMSTHSEEILHHAVYRREPLHVGGRREAPHLALPLTRRVVGDLGSIVRVLIRDVDHGRHYGAARGGVGAQLIGDQSSRETALGVQQLPKESDGCSPIPMRLHEDVQDVTVLVDRAPQILLATLDRDEHLVQIPRVAQATPAAPQPPRVVEPERPTAGWPGEVTLPGTGSPEAVTRLRLPQNGACGFPALRSSQTDSQHSECLQLPMRET